MRWPPGFVDRGGEFLEAAALGFEIGLLFDAGLFLFQIAVLGDEVLFHQTLEVLGALAGDGRGLFELLDDFLGRAAFGFALGDFGVDARNAGLVFAVLSVEDALLLRDALNSNTCADARWRFDSRRLAAGQRGQQTLGAGGLQPSRGQVVGGARAVGPGHGGVEFDQHLPRLDGLAVDHMDGLDGGGLDRLDQLAAFVGHDLPLRRGDHVDLAEDGPKQRDNGEGH